MMLCYDMQDMYSDVIKTFFKTKTLISRPRLYSSFKTKTKCSRPRPRFHDPRPRPPRLSFLSSRRLETKTLVSRTTSLDT